MKSILSTKKLTPSQKNLILGAGFSVVEYDAINIEFLDFELPDELKNLIFTSKNAVKAFLKKLSKQHVSNVETNTSPLPEERAEVRYFCVGSKTEALLLANDFNVVKSCPNASELGDFIAKNHHKEAFTFFCSEIRRAELPEILTKNQVSFKEITAYKTLLNPKPFKSLFDAVLFFSPSGVQSFTSANTLDNTLAVCIGNTTASEVQKHTAHFTIAHANTIESVIARAVHALN